MTDQPQSNIALVLDFDGTVTLANVGEIVINEFGRDGWQKASEAYHRGEISLRELWALELAHLRSGDHEAMRSRAMEVGEIRPGLVELVEFCGRNDISLEIASSGVRFYIEAILDKAGVAGLEVAVPDADYDDRGHGVMTFRHGLTDCGMTAMCKCERVWRQRRLGKTVVFVGDGATDFCVALQADHVLARDVLAGYCTQEGKNFTPFEDFFDVREFLARLGEG